MSQLANPNIAARPRPSMAALLAALLSALLAVPALASNFTAYFALNGEQVGLEFAPAGDIRAAAAALVQTYGMGELIENCRGAGATASDRAECATELVWLDCMRIPGFREAHDAAYGLAATTTDSTEYWLVQAACAQVQARAIAGMTAEIGTRGGGASELIMRWCRPAVHVAVDPYGDIAYAATDTNAAARFDYDDIMRRKTAAALYAVAAAEGVNLAFLFLEDTEFFARFGDGLPTYGPSGKRMETAYALVFLDGPHATDAILAEVDFFAPRVVHGGFLVFDDVETYDHSRVHAAMVARYGFKVFRVGHQKAIYEKDTEAPARLAALAEEWDSRWAAVSRGR